MTDRRPAVLLISPGIIRWVDMDFGLPHLVALGSHLEVHCGVRVEILDLNYESGSHRDLEQTIEALGPFVLIGLSTYSSFDYKRTMTLAKFLKNRWPHVPLVTGGYHASALPEDLIFDGSPFDAAIKGEGELPMARMVQQVLGGQAIEPSILPIELIDDINMLVPTNWSLLNRYWPKAHLLGRKLQIYLSRGCAYRCTFCMERAKSGYKWRAFHPERAVEELERVSRFTDLSHWVVNIADPLFGFHRGWRREVLKGIIDKKLIPRQYWTLTRSDDLDDVDIELLSKAQFSIGIGLESGSPRMLKLMQKGNKPDKYLQAVLHLARQSRKHGLNWATNVIVGHPGEDQESMLETHQFLNELFHVGGDTCGWVSIDPFRLYPGSDVHTDIQRWEQTTGAHFYSKNWWHRWYDNAFLAQYIDPSDRLNYEERVSFMFDKYPALVQSIHERFRMKGDSIDRVYKQSIAEQKNQLSTKNKDRLLRLAKATPKSMALTDMPSIPIGLNIKDPKIRLREDAVRHLLDRGVLRNGQLIEALLQVDPAVFLSDEKAKLMLSGSILPPPQAGLPNTVLSLPLIVRGLEQLEPLEGEHMADLGAVSGYVSALLAELVGGEGRVYAVHPCALTHALSKQLSPWKQVTVLSEPGLQHWGLDGPVDGIWINGAFPWAPRRFQSMLTDVGRAVCFVGPRFRAQDMVLLKKEGQQLTEHVIARAHASPLSVPEGWNRSHVDFGSSKARMETAPEGLRRGFKVLSMLRLTDDAANINSVDADSPSWLPLLERAYHKADGRLALQGLPLQFPELIDLIAALDKPPNALRNPEGMRLCSMFKTAVLSVDVKKIESSKPSLDLIFNDIMPLRAHLYQQINHNMPRLVVYDVPELGNSARAISLNGERRIALSTEQSTAHIRMQLLHEEIHPITDPMVLNGNKLDARSTRVCDEGYEIHLTLENTVLNVTEALLSQLRPDLLDDFYGWRQPFQ